MLAALELVHHLIFVTHLGFCLLGLIYYTPRGNNQFSIKRQPNTVLGTSVFEISRFVIFKSHPSKDCMQYTHHEVPREKSDEE